MRTRKLILLCTLLLAIVGCAPGAPVAERGEINGAAFRIDIPDHWDGRLVLYLHGYDPKPVTYGEKEEPMIAAMTNAGYAVAQSGYAAGGWAVEEAIADSQELLRYFKSKYGKPKMTLAMGHSMGGFLTMTMVEKFPETYDGGLPMCGPLAPAAWFMERQVFDLRVVFDYYFPGVLPPPNKVPQDYSQSPEVTAKIAAALKAEPGKAAEFLKYTRRKKIDEIPPIMAFWTFILMDIQKRAGGNPFDNTDTVYAGSANDDALNDGVKRYPSDPGAEVYLDTYYTPTGQLRRPMLHLHTTYDPLVPSEVPNFYASMTQAQGDGGLFVQRYVKRPGHCSFTPPEMVHALSDLEAWVKGGKRPAGGLEP